MQRKYYNIQFSVATNFQRQVEFQSLLYVLYEPFISHNLTKQNLLIKFIGSTPERSSHQKLKLFLFSLVDERKTGVIDERMSNE
jgi:hypothetical protein